jgi:hypothetical protein
MKLYNMATHLLPRKFTVIIRDKEGEAKTFRLRTLKTQTLILSFKINVPHA